MSWMEILKFNNLTNSYIQNELMAIKDLMGKYLDIDDGIYGPSKSIAILFKDAIDSLEDGNKYPDEEYTYNFKFLTRLIDEANEAQYDADNEGDREKEAHYTSIESRLEAIYATLQMRETLNRDDD